MNDPNGINYPEDKELRRILAEEIRKLQEESGPERLATVKAAEHWQENANKIVERLQAADDQEESEEESE